MLAFDEEKLTLLPRDDVKAYLHNISHAENC